MSGFWIHFNTGLKHLLTFHAYKDVLFLLALTVPYEFKSWKRVLILVSLFTAGHALALMLAVFNIITIKVSIITFLVPIMILIAAFYNLFVAGKSSKKESLTFIAIATSVFGIIHGFGFSNYFTHIVPGKPTDKLLPLFEASLGFGISQLIIIAASFVLASVVLSLFKFNKRDFVLMISSFVMGIVIPMIIKNIF